MNYGRESSVARVRPYQNAGKVICLGVCNAWTTTPGRLVRYAGMCFRADIIQMSSELEHLISCGFGCFEKPRGLCDD